MGEYEIQISKPTILVSRILRRYSRKNEKKIAEYISNQLKQDEMSKQLVLDFQDPFNG